MKSLLALLLIAAVSRAEPPAPAILTKGELDAKLPQIIMPPQSLADGGFASPAGQIGKPLLLTTKFQYIFQSDVEVVVRAFPEGLVMWPMETGPYVEKGFWADAPDAKEKTKRTFNKKYVYELIPVRTGQVTVLVIPIGFKNEKEIVQRIIDVNARGPPDDDKKKDEIKKDNPLVGEGLQFLITFNPKTVRSVEQQAIITGETARTYYETHCKDYRIWPTNQVLTAKEEQRFRDAYARKRDADDWIIISNGTTWTEQVLPPNTAEVIKLLRQYER